MRCLSLGNLLSQRLGVLNLRNCSLLLLLETLIKYLGHLHVKNEHDTDVLKSNNIIDLALVNEYSQIHVNLF